MSVPLSTYLRVIRLPSRSLGEAQPERARLNGTIHQAVQHLSRHEPSLQVERAEDAYGNCTFRVSANGYVLSVATRCGQDSAKRGGESRTFVSYTVTAETHLLALDRISKRYTSLSINLRIFGGVVGTALLYWGIPRLLDLLNIRSLDIPVNLLVVIVLFGAAVGERMGSLTGEILASRAWARAKREGALPQLELLWGETMQRINEITEPYEKL
ncbi:MAG: hypothetical protein U1G05_06985 [Kiritimatiellia bacterium]